MSTPHHHARRQIHAPATVGQRAADAVARGRGSWRFIIVQGCFMACWAALNGAAVLRLAGETFAREAKPCRMQPGIDRTREGTVFSVPRRGAA